MSVIDNKNENAADSVGAGSQGAVETWLVPVVFSTFLAVLGFVLVALYNFNGTISSISEQLAAQVERDNRDDERVSNIESRISVLDKRCDEGEITLGQLRILCTTAANPSGAGTEWNDWPFD